MGNRAIETEQRMRLALADVSQEQRDEYIRRTELDVIEFVAMQDARTIAQVQDLISLEESMTLYRWLNEWSSTSLYERLAAIAVIALVRPKLVA